MKINQVVLIVAGLLLIPSLISSGGSYASVLQNFLPQVEGFSAVPVWDYSQWSWGYGTAAGYNQSVKPPGTITREKAWTDALRVLDGLHATLATQVTRSLTGNEWGAVLSFSYNCGATAGSRLVPFLNANDSAGLAAKMRQYIYAGGQPLDGLKRRREREIALYNGTANTGRNALEIVEPFEWWNYGQVTDSPY